MKIDDLLTDTQKKIFKSDEYKEADNAVSEALSRGYDIIAMGHYCFLAGVKYAQKLKNNEQVRKDKNI